jgi:hypothetical protein
MITDPEMLLAQTKQRREDLRRTMERCAGNVRRHATEEPRPRDRGVVLPFRSVRRES